MELSNLFSCLALLLLGIYLLQQTAPLFRKLGMTSIWLAIGLGTYYLSDSIWLACMMLAVWIFFPVWEMVFILRQLRVPRHRELADARTPRDAVEEISSLTEELKDEGFDSVDECSLHPAQHEQYYRLMLRQDNLVQATIGYVAQGAIRFHFVAYTSMGKDGRRWVTWDYPLTYGLVMPPELIVFRALHCQDAHELYRAHLDFLEINEVGEEELVPFERTPEEARARLAETLNQQVEYNISRGYLAPVQEKDSENFCYSWRGTLYVARQVLRDSFF
jgi:hypothetical protein